MARYIAVGEMPELEETKFREAFNEFKKWRIDRQSWVIKAYWGKDHGKLVIECETPERSRFEAWLAKTGWQMNGIYQVDLIHEGGTIWTV